jgi:hypothetical protein
MKKGISHYQDKSMLIKVFSFHWVNRSWKITDLTTGSPNAYYASDIDTTYLRINEQIQTHAHVHSLCLSLSHTHTQKMSILEHLYKNNIFFVEVILLSFFWSKSSSSPSFIAIFITKIIVSNNWYTNNNHSVQSSFLRRKNV